MKILFVIDSLVGGGAERVIARLSNYLSEKHQVVICQTFKNKIDYSIDKKVTIIDASNLSTKFSYTLLALDIYFAIKLTLKKMNRHFFRNLRFISMFSTASLKLRDIIYKVKPDVIVSFLLNSNFVVLYNKKYFNLNIPVICAARNKIFEEADRLEPSFFYRQKLYDLYRYVDYYLAVTSEEIEQIRDNFKLPASRCFMIENYVSIPEIISMAEEALPDNLPKALYDRSAFKLVSAGRLVDVKNHKLILMALSNLNIKKYNIHLFLIGSGAEKIALQKMAAKMDIERHVHFLGWHINPFNILKKCDLFVLSSKWEGFPNILLEAMAIGMPVISTYSSQSVRNLLEEGNVGMLVETAKDMATKIQLFIDNPDMLISYGKKSSEKAQHFSINKMITKYEKMFRMVLSDDLQ